MTHGITYLPKADQIVVMKEGRISEVGTFKELLDCNGDFAEFMREFLHEEEEEGEGEEESMDSEGKYIAVGTIHKYYIKFINMYIYDRKIFVFLFVWFS